MVVKAFNIKVLDAAVTAAKAVTADAAVMAVAALVAIACAF